MHWRKYKSAGTSTGKYIHTTSSRVHMIQGPFSPCLYYLGALFQIVQEGAPYHLLPSSVTYEVVTLQLGWVEGGIFLQLALVSHVTAIRGKIRFLAIILAILLQTIIDVTTHSSSNEDLACILHNYAAHDVHEMYLACMIFASQLQSAKCSAQIRRELSSKDLLKKNPSDPYQFSLLTPHCPNCLSHTN